MNASGGPHLVAAIFVALLTAGCVAPEPATEPPATPQPQPSMTTDEHSFRGEGGLPWEGRAAGVTIYLNGGDRPHYVVPANATVLAFDVEAAADASLLDRPVQFRALCAAPETARGCDDGGLLAEVEGTLPLHLAMSDLAVAAHHILVFELVTDDPVAPFTMGQYTVEGVLLVETRADAA